jgi:fructose-bisphosphate aldolase / 2-amino-3,7-dideoxy-D-threo-hept-6-ulosonate synthase
MGSLGKEMRLRRFFRPDTGRSILFAASHGTATLQIFRELEDTEAQVLAALSGGADAVLISRGFAQASLSAFQQYPDRAFVLKASATSREDVPRETMTATVEGACRAGADAVGVLMQLTPSTETALFRAIAELGEQCDRYQLPLLVEAELPATYEQSDWYPEDQVVYLRRACRLAQEFGADVIKTNWPGNSDGFREIIDVVTVPVVVAGGPQVGDDTFFAMVEGALDSGAAGCSVGRNIFQAPDPQAMSERIAALVHAPQAVVA